MCRIVCEQRLTEREKCVCVCMCDDSSQYNPNYDFHCELEGRQCAMTFTSVAGHLFELDFAPSHRGWHTVPPQELFAAPLQRYVRDALQPLQRNLEREAAKCGVLILWLDCDREGENIAFEVRTRVVFVTHKVTEMCVRARARRE